MDPKTFVITKKTTYEELDNEFHLRQTDNTAKAGSSLFKVTLSYQGNVYLKAWATAIIFSGYEENDLKNRKITLWYCGDCIADIVQYKNDIEIVNMNLGR